MTVTTGKLTANINAALEPAAVISGAITNSAAAAVSSNVYVYDATTKALVGSGGTAANGSYQVGPLPGGSYLVEFAPRTAGYQTQYYNGQATLAAANAVTATVGHTTTGINATLPLPGAISGTVTGSSGGIEGVEVIADDAQGNVVADASTASDGTYTVSTLPAGAYHVEFLPSGGGLLPQYYKDEPTLASANAIAVTSGATTTGINAALQSGGEIAGTVTDSVSNAPLAGIDVQINGGSANSEYIGKAVTNTNGQYSFTGLPSGSYTVQFSDPTNDHVSQYYKASATASGAQAVAVTTGQVVAGIDAALVPSGSISGKVTIAGSSAGAAGATVTVYDSTGTAVTTATTGTDGTYTVAGLTAGSYGVGFSWGSPSTYPSQYYNGQPSLTGANAVTVTNAQTTPNIDGTLVPLPTSSAAPTIQGSPVEGQTLVEVHGSWSPGVTTYGYQWLSCTALGTACAPIPDANGPTFVPGPSQYGDELEVQEQGYGPSGPGAPATSIATTPVTAVPLKAVAGDDVQTTAGTPALFDGSGSTPAGEITGYSWNFGDGTTADGESVKHTYTTPGTYTATLTVTAPSGTSSASVQVVVTAAAPAAQITVLGTNAAPLVGADVVYLAPSGARISAVTNGSGVASLPGLPDGQDSVDAWASGYQPATGSVTVSGGVGQATITLTSGAVVTSSLTSTEMTLAQIEAAGINPNDPANNEVFNFSLNLAFAGNGMNFACHINAEGQFVGSCGFTGQGGASPGWSCSLDGCQGPGGSVVGGDTDGHPYIEWLTMNGQASALKQFFNVALTVTNLSPEPFDITGGSATLEIPGGLSLAPTSNPQSATQSVPTIAGSSSQSVHWIIRGDQAGSYNLSADYSGTLQPFGAPVSVQAGLVQPLKVWGVDALGLSVQADGGSLITGYPYHVRVAITDKADVPLYNVSIALPTTPPYGFIYQPDERFSDSVGELDPGQTFYSHWYILVPDGAVLGTFTPPLSSIGFAGQSASPGAGVTAVTPPTVYALNAVRDTPGYVHLHWQSVPGASGYEVFATPQIETPFAASATPVATSPGGALISTLPASANDAYIKSSFPAFYAVSTIVNSTPTLEHAVVGGVPAISAPETYGDSNPAERACGCSEGWRGDPVNTQTGDYSETDTDASVPGNGPALDATRTYDSLNASTLGDFGYGWSFSYGDHLVIDAAGNVTVVQASGAQVSFANTASGYVAASRVIASLTKNTNGTYTFVVAHRLTYTYDASGNLTAITDLNGYTTKLSRPDADHLVVTDPSGRALAYVLSGGHVTSLTDPAGNVTRYGYDAAGDLTSVTDPLGRATSYTYDSNHQLLTVTDPRGGVLTNSYDTQGRVVSQVDALGRKTTFDYTSTPGTTLVTDPRGVVTADTYVGGQLSSSTQAHGTAGAATSTYTYDPVTGGRTTVTDPLGDTTATAYDSQGNVLSVTDPLGRKTTYAYDALDDRTSMTDPLGETTSYTYDSHGNLLSTSAPIGGHTATTSYAYTASPGEVTAVTDPDGNVTHYGYDAAGDRTSVTDADGNTTAYVYDVLGRKTSQTTPDGHTTTYSYDAAGQLLKQTDPLGHATIYTYDRDGNRLTVTDAAGHTTTYAYDADNETTAVTRADGSVLRTAYDADGNTTGQTDGVGNTTAYAYDLFGRVITRTDPDGHVTRYTYDAVGHELTQTNPDGAITTYAYDADGEITGVRYSDGSTPNVSETYDADGHRLTMTDGSGTSSYIYDALGRLVAVTDGSGATVGYAYDLGGRLTSLTYPNGKAVTHAYDAAGRLTSIKDWLGNTTTFRYDADGDLTGQADPNGVTSTFGYDAADELTAITDANANSTLASFDYARDADGRVISETSPSDPGGAIDYTYNSLGQLTGAGSATYGYDAADNPTTFGGATQTFDPANELLTSSGSTTTTTSSTPTTTTSSTPTTTSSTPTTSTSTTTTTSSTPTTSTPTTTTTSSTPTTSTPTTTTTTTSTPTTTAVSSTTTSQASSPASSSSGQTGSGGGNPSGTVATQSATTSVATSSASSTSSTSTSGGHGGVQGFTSQPPNIAKTIVGATTHGKDTAAAKLPISAPGALVLAFITAGGPSGQRVSGVTGGGLDWSAVAAARGAAGVAEVWETHETGRTGSTVKVVAHLHDAGYPANITLAALAGNTALVAAHGTATAKKGVPTLTLDAPGGALLFAVAHTASSKAPTLVRGLALVDHAGSSWVARGDGPAAGGSTAVGATAPKAGAWQLAAVAVSAGASAATARPPVERTAVVPPRTASAPVGGPPPASAASNPSGADRTTRPGTERARPGVAFAALRVVATPAVVTGNTFTYNGDGDRTSVTGPAGTVSLRYDQADRLIGVGSGVSYAYDGDGLRTSKDVNGTTTQFVWDRSSSVPDLLQAGATDYIYGPTGLPIEQISGTTVTYLHQDQQGSTRLLTGSAGSVVGSYSYNAWGAVTAHTGSASSDLQYDGQYTDAETGYEYLRARYYDPGTGGFLTRDPAAAVTGAAYDFASDNPANFSDPSGLATITVCFGICLGWDTDHGEPIVGAGGISANVTVSGPHGSSVSYGGGTRSASPMSTASPPRRAAPAATSTGSREPR